MIERLVAFSVQRRWLVIALVALVTVASAGLAAHLFRINTDVERLIDKDVPWRQDEIAYEKAFPQRTGTLVAVIDGKTPEQAEEAAANLAKALADRKDTIESVYRPDGGPFYEKNGFLLMSQEELTKTTEQLVQQQGLLGPLAADPSLRGIMRVLSLGAKGVKSGDAKIEDLDRPMGQIDETLRTVLAGEPARLSWQTLLSNGKLQSTDLRKFVMIQPVLDYNALQPGATATAVVRKIAADLKINNGEYNVGGGARMRLTGPVAVADDEFATLAEDAFLNYSVTTGAIVLFVWLALRSASLVGAVLITTFAGLIVTAALGLLMVGELNPISVAFAALFVGLGIDFGIQFAVRYRADRFEQPDLPSALRAAARGVGWSLTLAAISLIAGFFAFLPTAFRGVSELGLIAGVGMIVAYLFSLTLLPALIAVFKPKTEAKAVETTWMAGVDHWIIEHRKAVLIGVGLVTVAGIPLLFKLPFDSNPMHLRSPKVESISTYLDLIKDPETSPNLIDVLAPSPEAVPDLAAKLRKLPSVAKVIDIDTFVPRDQDQKLAIIADTAQLLGPALNPGRKPPPPTDADNVKAIKDTAAALRTLTGARAAEALAGSLDKLATAPVATREAASVALTTDLKTLLTRLAGLLNPQKITLDNLPPKLKAEWVTADGRSRIEVHPSGDANDNVVLRRFAKEVQTVAPHATGAPVATTSSSYTILGAFVQAALTALVLIFIILSVALRKPWDVAMTLGPLVLATLWTLMALHVVGMPLNFANIIAMPLMLAVGVAFHIYYVIAWRAGVADMLASSLTRAIFFSALTTGTAFGSLVLSSHPGTASMGKLLALSLFFTLVAAFFVVPAFLGPPPKQPDPKRPEGDAAVPPDLQTRRPAEAVSAK
ncbi:hopanoid biosynthesis-associated RND transporter HpnN [Methylobacterium sp. Leaf99]|uniref:MMPL family transporter n=1 Tax=Methylobacterium sp. Leaf99 TaxID=1736251 RepID=UPI0006F2B57F|nr:MMPL family transporter [Methylobacterium sp. Leaf99]KQP07147.1 hopanoid biosynthesis-associated RND transporter HpnN [Methylobacterium sp. Leaf99]